MTRVEEIVEQVRALTPDEQEQVRMLLNDGAEGDVQLSPEWEEKVKQRIEAWEAGTAESRSWEDVRARLRERINAAEG